MELREEVLGLKQKGLEQAAMIWETLETLPQPIHPVNVYKVACSIKCAEFLTRVHQHPTFNEIMTSIVQFLDDTLKIVGDDANSDVDDGMRVVEVFHQTMPISEEIFNDPIAYATRQHVYDGIIMLSAAKMGKEVETKNCIDRLQTDIAKTMLWAMLLNGR